MPDRPEPLEFWNELRAEFLKLGLILRDPEPYDRETSLSLDEVVNALPPLPMRPQTLVVDEHGDTHVVYSEIKYEAYDTN